MTKIRNFWFAHRGRIARIIFWPYVISVIVSLLNNLYYCYRELEIGLDTTPRSILWSLTIMGTLCIPVANVRSWSAIFHDEAETIIASPVQWKDLLEEVSSIWPIIVAVVLGLSLLNSFLPGLLLALIQIIIVAALVIAIFVQVPVLCIGLVIYLRRLLKKKTKAS